MNDFAPKYIDRPREGFFKIRVRARRDGERWDAIPWMPVRFYMPVPRDPETGEILDRWCHLAAERGDEQLYDHGELLDLWPYCREITEAQWWELKLGDQTDQQENLLTVKPHF